MDPPSSDEIEEPETDCDLTQTQPIASQLQKPLPSLPLVQARLVPLSNCPNLKPFEIRSGCREVMVGRHPDCELVLADKRVSAQHLKICQRGGPGQFCVEQIGKNGCFINEHRLHAGETRELHHGDEMSLCLHAHETREAPFAAYLFRISGHDKRKTPAAPTVAAVARPHVSKATGRQVTERWMREHWDMRSPLGRGYFSEVIRSTEVKTGQVRAIKAIDKGKFSSFQADKGSLLSIMGEAEVLSKLEHPNIIRLFTYYESPMYLYIVLELVQGGDLLNYVIGHGCLQEPHAMRLFRELGSAVSYLHARNIVHRDIKPENILLTSADEEGHAKLADFGLARSDVKSRDCRTFCGTPSYFAPEVIGTFRQRQQGVCASGYGKPVDIWGLGVVLYIMLSGVPPFEEEGERLYEEIMKGRCEFDVPAWGEVSSEAKSLVRLLMTVDPLQRPGILQALDHPCVEQFRLELDSNDPPEEGSLPSSQPKRRRTGRANKGEDQSSSGGAHSLVDSMQRLRCHSS